jgi:hypothetical protein
MDATTAARSVLVEVLTVLAGYLDKLVIVGAWVPELLFPNRGHIGSTDVDLALDVTRILPAAYEAITRRLTDAGYERTDLPNRFVKGVGSSNVQVKVDLITGEFGEPCATQSHVQFQDMLVWKAHGVDLAFSFWTTVDVSGTLPRGGRQTLKARVPTASAYLCIKAITLAERMKEKDAYDIVFCVGNYPGGPRALASEFAPLMGHQLAQEGLTHLRAKFRTIEEVGPVWAAQAAEEAGEDKEIARRRAFELVSALLDELQVE